MFKNFFIPNPNNQYYPISIRPKFMYTYLVFMLIFNIFSSKFLTEFPTDISAQTTFSSSDIISLTNQDRSQNSLPALSENTQLDNAAMAKANDMFKYQYWDHYNPTTGASPWSFILASGYNYHFAGENLAEGFATAQDTNNAWMNSAEHKGNILNTDYKDIGVAVMSGTLQGSNVILVVQMFGALQATVQPTPISTPTPTAHPTSIPTLTPNPVIHTPTPLLKTTPSITATQTPKPTMTQTPSPTPTISIIGNITGSRMPTPTLPQKLINAKPTATIFPTPNVVKDLAVRVEGIKFANKVNILVGIFLLVIFSLDSLYYYKVRNIHKRSGVNSIAHLPLLIILITICIIGTNGITL